MQHYLLGKQSKISFLYFCHDTCIIYQMPVYLGVCSVPLAGFNDFLCPVTLVIVKTCNKSWCILEKFFISSCVPFFFSQDYLGYWSFAFPYTLELISVFTIIPLWFSLRWLWLSVSLGRIDVSAILSLSNHDYCICFDLFSPLLLSMKFCDFPGEDLHTSLWIYC